MPSLNYLNIAIPDVYIRVGSIDQTHVSQSDLRPKRPFEAKRYGLMVHWPRTLSWLSVQLRHGDPPEDFAEERDGLLAVCSAVGADPDHVAPAKFLQSQQYQIAVVSHDAPIQIRVRVDTDEERFRQAVLAQEGAAEREEFLQPIQVRFFDAKQLGTYLDQEGTITLIMTPAKAVPPFDGYGAVDLGNTSSTLVALSLSDAFYRTDSMRLVDADAARGDLRSHVDPVVSHVRVDRIKSYEPPPPGVRRFPNAPKDDYPQTVNWVAGRLASPQDVGTAATAATAGLVLGAKRLVAGKEWEKSQKLMA